MPWPQPGWHPDPWDPTLVRWWDGLSWTPSTWPRAAADGYGAVRPGRRPWAVGVLLAVLVLDAGFLVIAFRERWLVDVSGPRTAERQTCEMIAGNATLGALATGVALILGIVATASASSVRNLPGGQRRGELYLALGIMAIMATAATGCICLLGLGNSVVCGGAY